MDSFPPGSDFSGEHWPAVSHQHGAPRANSAAFRAAGVWPRAAPAVGHTRCLGLPHRHLVRTCCRRAHCACPRPRAFTRGWGGHESRVSGDGAEPRGRSSSGAAPTTASGRATKRPTTRVVVVVAVAATLDSDITFRRMSPIRRKNLVAASEPLTDYENCARARSRTRAAAH